MRWLTLPASTLDATSRRRGWLWVALGQPPEALAGRSARLRVVLGAEMLLPRSGEVSPGAVKAALVRSLSGASEHYALLGAQCSRRAAVNRRARDRYGADTDAGYLAEARALRDDAKALRLTRAAEVCTRYAQALAQRR